MKNIETKSAFVAIVGLTNVGKSSLMNALVGQKISIVSNKPQTTRNKITGILTQNETQFVFLDSPGIHKRKNKLSDYMSKQITSATLDIDVCILVVEATRKFISTIEENLINQIKNLKTNVILVVNKIDLLKKKEDILQVINMYKDKIDFDSIIPISVKKNDGLDLLLNELNKYTKPSPHFFSEDMVTDQMEREVISEIIREKILTYFSQEVPHGVAVFIEQMKERSNKILDVEAVIYCERYNHKGIIIGKKGEALKTIASMARLELEDMLGIKVNLQCWVKVKNNWRNDSRQMKWLGYDLNVKI